MPAALTPDLALAYLRELSADVTAAVLLDAAGERVAGPAELHAPARDLLAAAPPGPAELHGRTPAGAVFAGRDDAHQLVVVTGPLALPGLTRHDLRTALAALAGEAPAGAARGAPPEAPIAVPRDAVERLLAAAGRRL